MVGDYFSNHPSPVLLFVIDRSFTESTGDSEVFGAFFVDMREQMMNIQIIEILAKIFHTGKRKLKDELMAVVI